MSSLRYRGVRLALVLFAASVASCAPVISDLKAARASHVAALHEQLSQSIHDAGFSHGIRTVREDVREIDSIFVAVPLDSLKRRHESLHRMLFNVARLCARPEFSKIAIRIELNAADAADRDYMRGIVEPIVNGMPNVVVAAQEEGAGEVVITTNSSAP
jgi:hypothetical protein